MLGFRVNSMGVTNKKVGMNRPSFGQFVPNFWDELS